MNKIVLQFPVEVGGIRIVELSMRRSKIRDRLAISKTQATDEEKEIRLFANLCEVEPAVIEELDEADYQKLQKAYMAFFK